MSLTLQIEPVSVWAKDGWELMLAHWHELGLDQDLQLAPDIGKMELLEHQGMFFVITARSDGKMVGYVLALVHPHLHYCTSPPMLIMDAYYIDPNHRKIAGVRILKFTEAFARKVGCIKVYLSCKVHEDHSALFKMMGYRLSDYAFIKRIG